LQANLEAYLKLSISLSLSSIQASVDYAHTGYQQALSAMEGRFYQGKGGIYLYSESPGQSASRTSILDDAYLHRMEKELLTFLQNEQYGAAVDVIEAIFGYIRDNTRYTKADVVLRVTGLLLELQKFAQERSAPSIEWQDSVVNGVDSIPRMET
ncbi:hypothetical protein AB4Z21_37520, partial [Paenibacillus sp. MCAF20]